MEYLFTLETITAILGGGAGSVLMQVVKRLVTLTGLSAYVVSAILSFVIALVLSAINNEFVWAEIAKSFAFVFIASQTIFRFLLSKDAVVSTAPLGDV